MFLERFLFLYIIFGFVKCSDFCENNACSDLNDYPKSCLKKNCYFDPDVDSSQPNIAKRHGFQVTSYFVVTEDGYILQIYRVHPKENDNRRKKQPLVIGPGVFVDSSTLMIGGNKSIVLYFASQGYDVFLLPERSTPGSDEHVSLSRDDPEYDRYSLDESSTKDISVALKKIAEVTGKGGSIICIGISRSSTRLFFYMGDKIQEARKLIKGVIVLSPLIYVCPRGSAETIITSVGAFATRSISMNVRAAKTKSLIPIIKIFCKSVPNICYSLLEFLYGKTNNFWHEYFLYLFSHNPVDVNLQCANQYNQMLTSGKFQKYDYGENENSKRYGQKKPPVYNMSKIDIPVFIYYGKNDVYNEKKCLARLTNELGNKESYYKIIPLDNPDEEKAYNHADFYSAVNLKEELLNHLDTVIVKKWLK